MQLSQLSEALEARLENGSPNTEITGVAGIEEATTGQITFVANPKYASAAKTTKASAVIVSENFPAVPVALLRSKNPYLTFARAIELFYQPPQYRPGTHPTAVVHPSARVGKKAHIGPYVVIDENVSIGPNAVLLAHAVIYRDVTIGSDFFAHAHAVVREGCRLGDNVVLQNGAVIGADGFGFAKDDVGRWHKIVQSGPAVLEDDVEVQANACVDRASIGETRVGRGARIHDSLLLGADYYETLDELERSAARGVPPIGIGSDSVVRRAIVDKNARIGRGVRIVNEAGVQETDGSGYYIREGIVVVPKGGVVPDGAVI